MLHVSTRGEAPALSFSDALLTGLARDGGLYLPQSWPTLDKAEIAGFAGQPYATVAERILGALSDGDVEPQALGRMIHEAYATFRHPAVCPLTQIGDNLFVETPASGAPQDSVAATDGYGDLQQSQLEQANVEAVTEISNLISAQRAYEMNSKVITTADEMASTISKGMR